MAEKKLWIRPATGLVKSFSTFDMWLFNTFSGVPILQPWYMFPLIAFYPGGDFLIGGTLALFIACIPPTVYAFMAASMPRSGGDYVYWSRLMHPALGFMISLSLVFWINWWVGSNMWGTAAFFGDLLTEVGSTGLAGWVYSVPGTLVSGILLTLLLVLILMFYVKGFKIIQLLCFGWALLACIEMIILVLALSPAFRANIVQYIGVSEQQVLTAASEAGFDPKPVLAQSFLPMMALMWYAMVFAWPSQYVSGEMKSAETLRVQVIAIVLGGFTTGLFTLLMYGAIYAGLGKDFYNALVWLFYFSPEKYPLGSVAPWMWNLAKIMTGNNPIVGLSLTVPLFLSEWFLNAINFLIFSRIFFAWAWDRVMPKQMAYVSRRWHTPVVALAICFITGTISFVLQTLKESIGIPWLTDLMAATVGALMLIFAVSMFMAAYVPYHNKEFYRGSPMKKYKLGGIPLITVLGLCGGILLLIMMYQYVNMAMLNIQWLLPSALAIFAVSLIVYYVIKAIRKSQGIDISLAFKEIPSE